MFIHLFSLLLCFVMAQDIEVVEMGPDVMVSSESTSTPTCRSTRFATTMITSCSGCHSGDRCLCEQNLSFLCTLSQESGNNPNITLFDSDSWLTTPWTNDGETVYQFSHHEYHGEIYRDPEYLNDPSVCPSDELSNCWYASVIRSKSTDGGITFRILALENRVFLASPLPYQPDAGRQGIVMATNIFHDRDQYEPWWYILYSVTGNGAEGTTWAGGGACLARSKTPEFRNSWRAWDGSSFTKNISFDAYVSPPSVSVNESMCTPLPQSFARVLRFGITFNTYLDRYISVSKRLIFGNGRDQPATGADFYLLTSDDLITWSQQNSIFNVSKADLLSDWGASRRPSNITFDHYPSLVDLATKQLDESRVYDRTGRAPYLLYVHGNAKHADSGVPEAADHRNRDIWMQRIRFTAPLRARLSRVQADCGSSVGRAVVTIGGGEPPYSVSWSDDATQNVRARVDLPLGAIEVTVTDSEGTQASDSATILMQCETSSSIVSVEPTNDDGTAVSTSVYGATSVGVDVSTSVGDDGTGVDATSNAPATTSTVSTSTVSNGSASDDDDSDGFEPNSTSEAFDPVIVGGVAAGVSVCLIILMIILCYSLYGGSSRTQNRTVRTSQEMPMKRQSYARASRTSHVRSSRHLRRGNTGEGVRRSVDPYTGGIYAAAPATLMQGTPAQHAMIQHPNAGMDTAEFYLRK